MGEKMSNIVSHMCGYCSKIFEGEHDLDKHIEEIHFLEVLNEADEEDGEDPLTANVGKVGGKKMRKRLSQADSSETGGR